MKALEFVDNVKNFLSSSLTKKQIKLYFVRFASLLKYLSVRPEPTFQAHPSRVGSPDRIGHTLFSSELTNEPNNLECYIELFWKGLLGLLIILPI